MSNSLENRMWLSREGKTDGPFTPDQVQAMKAAGEYSKYAWCWEESAKSWKPIHPVPPPPAGGPASNAQAPAPGAQVPSRPALDAKAPEAKAASAKASEPAQQALARALSAVCHDNRHIIGGTISSVSGTDSFFKSADHLDAFPPFRKGHLLWVNLLDEGSGQSENARAEIVDLKKSEKHWEYRLKWKEVPKIISV